MKPRLSVSSARRGFHSRLTKMAMGRTPVDKRLNLLERPDRLPYSNLWGLFEDKEFLTAYGVKAVWMCGQARLFEPGAEPHEQRTDALYLVYEAVRRIVEGERQWKPGWDFAWLLKASLVSLITDERNKRKRAAKRQQLIPVGEEFLSVLLDETDTFPLALGAKERRVDYNTYAMSDPERRYRYSQAVAVIRDIAEELDEQCQEYLSFVLAQDDLMLSSTCNRDLAEMMTTLTSSGGDKVREVQYVRERVERAMGPVRKIIRPRRQIEAFL